MTFHDDPDEPWIEDSDGEEFLEEDEVESLVDEDCTVLMAFTMNPAMQTLFNELTERVGTSYADVVMRAMALLRAIIEGEENGGYPAIVYEKEEYEECHIVPIEWT